MSDHPPDELITVVSAVADVLRRTWGSDVRAAQTELVRAGGRNLVVRCTLDGAAALPQRSVVAKALRRDVALGLADWALICTAERLRDGTSDVEGFEPLSDLGAELARTFRRRWPEYGDVRPRWGYEGLRFGS